jgi:hypothetical protein
MHRTNEDRADLQVGGKRIWQNLGMMTTESSNEEDGLNRQLLRKWERRS